MPGPLESFPGDVFTATPDHDALYMHAGVKAALAVMLHGIRTRRGIVTLIGPSGTGKTTLLRHVADHLDGQALAIFVANPPDTFDELLDIICERCGVARGEDTRTAARLAALNEHLIATLVEDQRVVIFIDEAQQLPELVLRQLRLLANLETSRERLLQVVLAGQPELLDMLRKPDSERLRQRISGWARLEPLNRRESLEYVTTRFLAAGLERRRYFRDVELYGIARAAGGIPRVINVICDNALVAALARSSMPVSTGDAVRAIRRVTGRRALWLVVRGGATGLWGGTRALRRMMRLDPAMRIAIRSRFPEPDSRLGMVMAVGAVALVLAAAELRFTEAGVVRSLWSRLGGKSADALAPTRVDGTAIAAVAPDAVHVSDAAAQMQPNRLVITRDGAAVSPAEPAAAVASAAVQPGIAVGASAAPAPSKAAEVAQAHAGSGAPQPAGGAGPSGADKAAPPLLAVEVEEPVADDDAGESLPEVVAAGIGLDALTRAAGPRVSERELTKPASAQREPSREPAKSTASTPRPQPQTEQPSRAPTPPPAPAAVAARPVAAPPAPSARPLPPPGPPARVGALAPAAARPRSVEPYCGDGILALTEECDDGNKDDTDRCLSNCMQNVCGDGILHVGVEECDDGDPHNDDACLFGCALARCGDGYVHVGVEECDDGNDVDDDGCTSSCTNGVRIGSYRGR